jgi:hypothetical protein
MEIFKDFIAFEDPNIYDGWILQFNPETKEILWRVDHWMFTTLTDEKKKETEDYIVNNIFNCDKDVE